MLSMRSSEQVSSQHASIREVPMASKRHLFQTVIDSPSLVQPSACLRKCRCTRNCYSTGQSALQRSILACLDHMGQPCDESENTRLHPLWKTAEVRAFLSLSEPGWEQKPKSASMSPIF